MKTPKTTEEMIEEWDELIKVSTKLELRQWLQSTLSQLANQIHTQSALEAERDKGIKWMQEGTNKNRKGFTDGYNQALTNLADYHRSKVIE